MPTSAPLCDLKTAIVYNCENSKQLGIVPSYYRLRNCDTNLTSNTPANQYQTQKIIQNTVRVYASLYTANVGPLSAYVKPPTDPSKGEYGVCWNQMSDRPKASVQKGVIPTGSNCSLNRRHTSVTSSRPGCQAPGGIGCDIKHNSYDRYLNRLKGKGPLRRGIVPPTFGAPLPFNQSYPIYGGKTIKTNIVTGCDCPIDNKSVNLKEDIQLFNNPLWQPDPLGVCGFSVGEYVYAIQKGDYYYSRAKIISIANSVYTVEFDDGHLQIVHSANDLLEYNVCNKGGTIDNNTYCSGFKNENHNKHLDCLYPEITTNYIN